MPLKTLPIEGKLKNTQGAAKAFMTRKIKEMKDLEKRVVLCQIETVRNTFKKDESNDAKLTLLENTLHIVE